MINEYKTPFLRLSPAEQLVAVEALIFSSDEPVTVQNLFNVLIKSELFPSFGDSINVPNEDAELPNQISFDSDSAIKSNQKKEAPEATPQFFEKIIEEINNELYSTGRPYRIIKIANGWQFATREEYGRLVQQLTKSKNNRRLSQAALEVLAIIAYRQPVTKPEIEQIRGVSSGEVINSLVDKNLIEILGRKDSLGKPLIYGTTNEFLKLFGLFSIEDLPKLREFTEIAPKENEETIVDLSEDIIFSRQENVPESNETISSEEIY